MRWNRTALLMIPSMFMEPPVWRRSVPLDGAWWRYDGKSLSESSVPTSGLSDPIGQVCDIEKTKVLWISNNRLGIAMFSVVDELDVCSGPFRMILLLLMSWMIRLSSWGITHAVLLYITKEERGGWWRIDSFYFRESKWWWMSGVSGMWKIREMNERLIVDGGPV